VSRDGAPLLAVEDLTVEFHLRSGRLRAVDGVSFTLEPGQTMALVGESGSGKSATALAIMRLHAVPPCVYAGGRILFRGQDLLRLSERSMYQVRGGEIAMSSRTP
jgi:peptide/nickel transport system ATP-binding protein/oligopeptide transport system ATP-binding protein